MRPPDLFRLTLHALDRLEIEYFVGGSVASSYWGRPRLTEDLDVIVALSSAHVSAICALFPQPEFYLSEDAALDALQHGTQFNLIHSSTGFKVDFMLLKDNGFASSQMSRRVRRELLGDLDAWVASPEDVILSKLLYYREGRSDKHINDIAPILQRQQAHLDINYLNDWALRTGVAAEWREIQARFPTQ